MSSQGTLTAVTHGPSRAALGPVDGLPRAVRTDTSLWTFGERGLREGGGRL